MVELCACLSQWKKGLSALMGGPALPAVARVLQALLATPPTSRATAQPCAGVSAQGHVDQGPGTRNLLLLVRPPALAPTSSPQRKGAFSKCHKGITFIEHSLGEAGFLPPGAVFFQLTQG